MKNHLFYAALFYLVFVVYGSLVPLDFKPMQMDEAIESFINIKYLDLGIGSLADWVANILLMIPMAFLWFTLLTVNAKHLTKFFYFLGIWLACFLLALAIEFTQIYFPPRTVSINDIIAESLGAFLGATIGWLFGQRFLMWLKQWYQKESNAYERYLQIYLFGVFSYAVLPLDLTLSPIELYHKWNEGRIVLLPFSNLKPNFIENVFEWAGDAVLWILVPLLWQRTGCFTRPQLYLRVFFAALTIEFFQLFVYSRVTDTTDILLAVLGGGIGIQVAKYFSDTSDKTEPIGRLIVLNKLRWLWIWLFLFWDALLVAVFWYPFNFVIGKAFISERIEAFFKVPFYSYYYGSEFRAVTEVFHKVLFFMPLGVVLAFICYSSRFNIFSRIVSYSCIAFIALGIEAGQILLPGKNADLTDWLLEAVGGLIGYVITQQLLMRQFFEQSAAESDRQSIVNAELIERNAQEKAVNLNHRVASKLDQSTEKKGTPKMLLFGIGMLALALYIFGQLAFIPYNVRELISGQYTWLRCFGLSLILFWCMGFPVWFLARILTKKQECFWCSLFGVTIHSVIAWALIRLSIPLESIHDIVGSPVLVNIPAEIEIFIRFIALFGIFSLLLFGAVLVLNSLLGCYRNLLGYYVSGFIFFIFLLPIYYWGVVLEAATDNIIELLPNEGRSWLIMLLTLYIFLFTFVGSACSALLAFKQWHKLSWIALIGLISYPLGYFLMQWGTEQFIMKYDAVFSALQFLFSTDRNHYVTGEALRLRFFTAHTAIMLLIIITQFPIWRTIHSRQK